MVYYILYVCIGVIIILAYFLIQKHEIQFHALEEYRQELAKTIQELHDITQQRDAAENDLKSAVNVRQYNEQLAREYEEKISQMEKRYDTLLNDRMKEVDSIVEETAARRMEQLRETVNEAKAKYDL